MSFSNINQILENVTLTLDSIDLQNSIHQIRFMDMNITNSKLINYYLKFGKKQKYYTGKRNQFFATNSVISNLGKYQRTAIEIYHGQAEFAQVNNSHMGQLNKATSKYAYDRWSRWFRYTGIKRKEYGGTSISLFNSSAKFLHIKMSGAKQVILYATHESSIFLSNCIFRGNFVRKESIISIHDSTLTINECTFHGNHGRKGGVIEATGNFTTLQIRKSNFAHNSAFWSGGVLHTAYVKNVDIISSNFDNNTAHDHGGVIISTNTEVINIAHTRFLNNTAKMGDAGVLSMAKETNCTISNSEFIGNSAGKNGGVIDAINASLSIENANFTKNMAGLNTGVIKVVQNALIKLVACNFTENSAKLTESVISANINVTMTIQRCHFERNPSSFTGFLQAKFGVHIDIAKSTFFLNSADVGSLVELGYSTINVTSSKFLHNMGGSLIHGYISRLSFSGCTFTNHSLAADPVMVISNANLTLNNSTFTRNTQHKEGGVVIAQANSIVQVTYCHFESNRASKGGVFQLRENSALLVEDSTFWNNTAGDGGAAHLKDSEATFLRCNISNCSTTGYGGIAAVYNSKLYAINSTFSSSDAVYGGCFDLQPGSSLAAYNSVFENNTARNGGVLYKYGTGNVSFENCQLINNRGKFGGAICMDKSNYLRLANGSCRYHYQKGQNINCILFQKQYPDTFQYTFYTFDFLISNGNETAKSNSSQFWNVINKDKMIFGNSSWLETPFASCK